MTHRYHQMTLMELANLAKTGDKIAANHFLVKRFNQNTRPGDFVILKKSEIEGKVKIKTVNPGRLLSGNDHPVVPLEAIGDVLLERLEPI
jgi:hypothetical protein